MAQVFCGNSPPPHTHTRNIDVDPQGALDIVKAFTRHPPGLTTFCLTNCEFRMHSLHEGGGMHATFASFQAEFCELPMMRVLVNTLATCRAS